MLFVGKHGILERGDRKLSSFGDLVKDHHTAPRRFEDKRGIPAFVQARDDR